jgi:hypothetical protein
VSDSEKDKKDERECSGYFDKPRKAHLIAIEQKELWEEASESSQPVELYVKEIMRAGFYTYLRVISWRVKKEEA